MSFLENFDCLGMEKMMTEMTGPLTMNLLNPNFLPHFVPLQAWLHKWHQMMPEQVKLLNQKLLLKLVIPQIYENEANANKLADTFYAQFL